MKRNLFYFTTIGFIILIFLNYTIVLSSTVEAVNIWLYKVFPFLFIMLVINDLLINMDFARIFKNNIQYIFIMSMLSGTPSSAYIINNLYQEHKISKNNANLSLMFTYFCNPIFLYSMLNLIFQNNKIVIKLMLIHYFSNIFIYLLCHKKIEKEPIGFHPFKFNLPSAIKKSMNTLIMVLGSIVLFMVISEILVNQFNLSLFLKLPLKGILEVTQGLNMLIDINISLKIKEMIAIAFISFGGLSIHTQIKCILESSDLNYSYFLYGRIIGLIIACICTAIA